MITEDIRVNGGVIILTFKDDVVEDERWYATDKFDYYQFILTGIEGNWMVKMAVGVDWLDIITLKTADFAPITQAHINLVPMFSDEVGFHKYFATTNERKPETVALWIADNVLLSRGEELKLRRKLVNLWDVRRNLPAVLSSGDDVPNAADDA